MGNLGTVEKKIHAIVDRMGADVEYLFMNWAQTNVEIDNITKPTVVYVLPPAGSLSFHRMRVYDYPETQIGFLSPTDFDFEGEENDGIIEYMKRLAVLFIKTLNESDEFEMIEGPVQYQVVYDYLDQNVTGIIISLKLKEECGISVCGEEIARIQKSLSVDEDDSLIKETE